MATSEIAKLESRWRENPQGLTFAPLAEAYRKLKDPARALEVLRPGLERHPDYIPANIVLGRCHWDLNDLPAAERAFTHVLGLDAENVIALKALADITERLGRYDEAERQLEALLAVDRSNEEARTQLARVRTLQPEQGTGTVAAAAGAEAVAESPGGEAVGFEPTALDAGDIPTPFETTVASDSPGSEAADDLATIEPMDLEPTAFEPTEFEATGFAAPIPVAESATAEADASSPEEPAGFESFDSVSLADVPTSGVEPMSDEFIAQDEFVPPPRDAVASLEPNDAVDAPEPAAETRSPAHAAFDDFGVERSEEIQLDAGNSEFQAPSAAEDLMQTAGPQGDALQPEPHVADAASAEDTSDEARWNQADGAIELAGAFAGYDAEAAPDVDLDRPLDAEPAGGFVAHEASAAPAPEDAMAEAVESHPPREADAFAAPVAEFTPEPAMEPAPGRGPEAESHVAQATPAVPPPLAAGTDHLAEPEPDLVVTETMAEVYLRQGHVVEALAVYRELSRRSPNDLGLRNRIAELEMRAAAARGDRRAYAASETGGQAVGAFLRSVLEARPAAVGGPRWSHPAGSPAEALSTGGSGAGADVSDEPSSDAGAPTRPAGDPLSLGSVFGEEPPAAAPAMPEAKSAPGVSFDEFFGAQRTPSSGTARPDPAPGGKGDDDLDQFHTWLQGLKR